ncbi:MAG: hypothetical protein E7552_02790 [Ruminococcaceae bacterium]|nr:hypothetical protein [Oscillospiraceae bacterium]
METIEKNTVKAENQLKADQYITYINPNGKGKRFLVVGNSITRHGVKHDIGWHNDWGMAASDIERDYVHILYRALCERYPDAVMCITQVATWEREFKNGTAILPTFQEARRFGADALVMRLVENCPNNAEDIPLFKKRYVEFVEFLRGDTVSQTVVTTGFWHHRFDAGIRECADENGYTLVTLGDLGEDESMKAIGLFHHEGVANHPGNKGMQAIADRILAGLAEK